VPFAFRNFGGLRYLKPIDEPESGGRRLRSRGTFKSLGNWLPAFTSMQDLVLGDGDLGRPPLGWREEGMPRWLDGLRPIFSLG